MKKVEMDQNLLSYHQIYCNKRLIKIIDKNLKNVSKGNEIKIKRIIYKDNLDFFDKLIKLPPVKLFSFHKKIIKKIELIDPVFYEEVGKDIKNMYNNFSKFNKPENPLKNPYISFTSSVSDFDFTKGWKAYYFTFLLNVKICPYCNLNSTVTYYAENSSISYATVRPTLDHFFPKSKYPWLSMSVYNLIPSCTHCNSSIKKTSEFSLFRSIHPYIEGVDDYLLFKREYTLENPVETILGENNHFNIATKKRNNKIKDYDYNRAKNTIDFFHLSERYSFYKDMIQREIKNNVIYTEKYLNDLEKNFPGVGKKLTKYNLSTNQMDIDKIILGKLVKDILSDQKSEMYYL